MSNWLFQSLLTVSVTLKDMKDQGLNSVSRIKQSEHVQQLINYAEKLTYQ